MRVSFDDLLQVRIPAHMAGRVQACAEARDTTISELVREAIRDRIETFRFGVGIAPYTPNAWVAGPLVGQPAEERERRPMVPQQRWPAGRLW